MYTCHLKNRSTVLLYPNLKYRHLSSSQVRLSGLCYSVPYISQLNHNILT